MTFFEFRSSAVMAVATVREHKVRSLLTVLGIIIGTGAVIAVGSIITGVNGAITDMATAFGPETIFSFQFNLGFRGALQAEELKRKKFTWEMGQQLAERCPSVDHVSPYLFSPNTFGQGGWVDLAKYGGRDIYNVEIAGTTERYAAGGAQRVLYGRFFTDEESRHRQPVVVIGEHVYKALFQGGDPVGKWIQVDGHQLQVVGVIGNAVGFPGQEDRRVLLPYFTMHKIFPTADEIMFVIVARKGMVDRAMDEAEAALRQLRKTPPSKPDDFWLATGGQMLDDFHRITGTIAVVMVALSSIGLLVGGIGVMNIMLVSVTERTREIGIRKAVGARRADIVVQFLTEAVVLTAIGGFLGMSLGWLISTLMRLAFPSLPTSVPLWAAALGVGVSVGVGLFFGTWPAVKAAKLDPVVALQYE
ncbi:MAG TPA: ABC transporter permease [Bryobacteraceae bacterium]|jgi:putative ABC transport system permease protein|nr:ABC transporter permease [Bryobacteraceae bacterium]